MLVSLLIFLVILSVLVLIHEFGHYIVARKLGIKVEEFGLGFPPRVYSIKRGETVFSLNLFPIGGFVRLHGEDEAGSGRLGTMKRGAHDLKRAFFARPPWQRALVAIAGVIMNFLLAVVIFYAFLGLSSFQAELPKLSDHNFYFANTTEETDVVIAEVVEDSPAAQAGIESPSIVVAVEGQDIHTLQEFTGVVEANVGEELSITLRDTVSQQDQYTVLVTPRVDPPENEGALGVALFPYERFLISHDSFGQKLFSGFTYPVNLMAYNINVIGELIGESFRQRSVEPVGEGVAGPVGIFAIVDQVTQIPDMRERVMQILNIAGLLSISLAFFNILPIPALDGGRLAFIGIEKIFGRAISVKFESYAHAVGMVLLLGLIILITIRDIGRFF